jgi:hypothetical protein
MALSVSHVVFKRGQSISTEPVMQFTEEHVNKRFQAHRFLYSVFADMYIY